MDDPAEKFDLVYWLFGYWIRRDACRLAAQALRAKPVQPAVQQLITRND